MRVSADEFLRIEEAAARLFPQASGPVSALARTAIDEYLVRHEEDLIARKLDAAKATLPPTTPLPHVAPKTEGPRS